MGDLIETFKFLKQYFHIDYTKFFTLSPINFTRGMIINFINPDPSFSQDPGSLPIVSLINGMLYRVK